MVPTSLLEALHEHFGPPRRERDVVIEYRPEGPWLRTWNDSTAWITLEERCQSDRLVYLFQLAHELVHTLDPVPFGQASVLEGGAATYFQHWYIRERLPFDDERRSHWCKSEDPEYKPAQDLVASFLELDPSALRRLRDAGDTLSLDSAGTLIAFVPSLERPIADKLVQRFEDWRKTCGLV